MHRRPRLSPGRVTVLVVGVLVVVLGAGLVLVDRSSPAPRYASEELIDAHDPDLSLTVDPARKSYAAQITSTFENSTLELQYDYVEDIGDGRGLTAGRAGFTSGTSDLLLLVQRYTQVEPENELAKYIPALEQVDGTDSTEGLDGFAEDWAEAARDPEQRQLQDDLVDELYFEPAMTLAADAGIETPLGQAIFWDTMIQHGAGGPNGTRAIIDETQEEFGDVGEDEPAWLDAFLDVRLDHMVGLYADMTEEAAESSESRIDALRSLVYDGELALQPPLTWQVYGEEFTLSGP